MAEIKTPEVNEIKKPEPENFKNIQPEKGMSGEKAKGFWDGVFDKIGETSEKVKDNSESEKSSDNVDVIGKLSPEQVNELSSRGMSKEAIEKCTYEDGVYKIETKNDSLEGNVHSKTGVPFERKIIDLDGVKVEGVFAKFDSAFTVQLPVDKLRSSDTAQFNECMSQLKEALKANPDLKNEIGFTAREMAQIESGTKPGRYTWHHNEELGKMELVKADIHADTGHTGGKSIWGGGRTPDKAD